ncbi:Rha family transcriptional regulator [Halopseudomonas aestusnigri]|uniref:Rha family transcriptional regulator n=1 Tax=Halopseudomonas aestusnigri TaxID=857252 RepID=UPI0032D94FC3
MSSREIAELLGFRHDNVKRTIERLVDRGVIGLPPLEVYLDTLGRRATEYRIGKRDSYVIVAQLSPEFTARLVDRWQELEEQVAQKPTLPQTFAPSPSGIPRND